MGELAQVAVGKPVGDRSGERGSYRPHAQPNSFATCRHGNVRAHSASVSSPKLTASVERGSRTHAEEFWQVHELPWHITKVRRHLHRWQRTDNSPSCSRRSLRTSLKFPQDSGIVAQPFFCLTSPARLQPIDNVYLTNHIAKEVC